MLRREDPRLENVVAAMVDGARKLAEGKALRGGLALERAKKAYLGLSGGRLTTADLDIAVHLVPLMGGVDERLAESAARELLLRQLASDGIEADPPRELVVVDQAWHALAEAGREVGESRYNAAWASVLDV